MKAKDDVIKTKESFLALSSDEQADELKRSFYKLADSALEHMFRARRMQILALPDCKDELDIYITTKSQELIEKYDNFSKEELLIDAITQLVDKHGKGIIGELIK